MSNERDELAGLLFTTDNSKSVNPWSEWEHCKNEPRIVEYVYAMADAILAKYVVIPKALQDSINRVIETHKGAPE